MPNTRQRISPKALRVAASGVLMPVLFITAFLLPAHDPKANGLPIAVVGSTRAARPIVVGMADVDLLPVSSVRGATNEVENRQVYGAIITGPHQSIIIASGASFVVASGLREGAVQDGVSPSSVHDLAPLPAGDPRGVVLNLVLLALLITSITGAAFAVRMLPDLRAGSRELHLLPVALIVGTSTTAILKAFNALPGSFVSEAWLISALVFSVTLVAAALLRLKDAGVTLAFLLFVVLAQPASGLTSAPELLPTPWKQLGPLFPPGALGSALRGLAFFGGAGTSGPIVILAMWSLIGLASNALLDRRHSDDSEHSVGAARTSLPDRDQAAVA